MIIEKKQIEGLFKFKIGDVVMTTTFSQMKQTSKHIKPQLLQVVERNIQECYGGVQIHYDVRAHVIGEFGSSAAFHQNLFRLTEPELMLIPDSEIKPES